LASGTRQSSSVMPWVSEACQPSLWYGGSMIMPGVPAGTTNAEMPSSVRAVTVVSEVISVPQLVMNAFEPLITHSPVVEHGPGLRRAGVGAAVGLGETEPAECTTGDEVGQPFGLLLVGTRTGRSGWRPGRRRPTA
jgi:hypothetical protein